MFRTNATFLAWLGDLPRYIPTRDRSFHLWNICLCCSASSRTYVGQPNTLWCFVFACTIDCEKICSAVRLFSSIMFGVSFKQSLAINLASLHFSICAGHVSSLPLSIPAVILFYTQPTHVKVSCCLFSLH